MGLDLLDHRPGRRRGRRVVFVGAPWARWVGILAATIQAIFAFFWLFSPYWPGALVIIVIDMLVLHALVAYGARDDVYA